MSNEANELFSQWPPPEQDLTDEDFQQVSEIGSQYVIDTLRGLGKDIAEITDEERISILIAAIDNALKEYIDNKE